MDALKDFESYWSTVCTAVGGHVENDDALQLHAPLAGPPLNGIFRFGTKPADELIITYKDEGAPFSVLATDEDIAAAALRHGMASQPFVLIQAPVRDMGKPLRSIIENDVEEFVRLQMVCHGIPPRARPQVIAGWRRLIAEGKAHIFVAWDQGPAGCAALYTGGGHAGLYAFGVLPEKRRRGIATALTQACMQRAIKLGLTTAVAATTKDGFGLAQSLGASSQLEAKQFVWMPTGNSN